MTAIETPYDPGLQPERTLLAWRRTCLALAVGVAVATRLALDAAGPAVAVLGLGGVMLCALAWAAAGRRYRAAHRGLRMDDALPTAGGPIALTALVAVLTALAAGVAVVALAGMP